MNVKRQPEATGLTIDIKHQPDTCVHSCLTTDEKMFYIQAKMMSCMYINDKNHNHDPQDIPS